MTTTTPLTNLTTTQYAVLTYAIEHSDGKLIWFPKHIKGGARSKVLDALASRALIAADGSDWRVADAGYAALGLARPAPMPLVNDPEIEVTISAAEAEWSQQSKPADVQPEDAQTHRTSTKQALVIQMLKRPEGATVIQIMEATGWLNHTVRGTLSGVLRHRLGLSVVSTKGADGVRTYRIA